MNGVLRELSLFTGAGGGLLASRLLGWRTVGAVEINPYCRGVLRARQADGILDQFPIFEDVQEFDGRPWRGRVDVVSGGFPCQDISAAGKGKGIAGERSGLVFEMLRIIEEIRPRFVFAENSPLLRTRGLGRILRELDRLGYDAAWGVLGAWHAGAPHRRNRMWIVASNADGFENGDEQGRGSRESRKRAAESRYDGETGYVADAAKLQQRKRRKQSPGDYTFRHCGKTGFESEPTEDMADPANVGREPRRAKSIPIDETTFSKRKSEPTRNDPANSWWATEPDVGRVADGVAHRVDRLKAIGNGQVPIVAAMAWRILSETLGVSPGGLKRTQKEKMIKNEKRVDNAENAIYYLY